MQETQRKRKRVVIFELVLQESADPRGPDTRPQLFTVWSTKDTLTVLHINKNEKHWSTELLLNFLTSVPTERFQTIVKPEKECIDKKNIN